MYRGIQLTTFAQTTPQPHPHHNFFQKVWCWCGLGEGCQLYATVRPRYSARTKQISPGPGCSVAQIIDEFFSVANAYFEVASTHCSYVSNLASPSAIRFTWENPTTKVAAAEYDWECDCSWINNRPVAIWTWRNANKKSEKQLAYCGWHIKLLTKKIRRRIPYRVCHGSSPHGLFRIFKYDGPNPLKRVKASL